MKEGDILLTALKQSDGALKDRPVVFLRRMPPFQDFLVCGVRHSGAAGRCGPGRVDYTSGSRFSYKWLEGTLRDSPRIPRGSAEIRI
jgi:mRNA interferase MazF